MLILLVVARFSQAAAKSNLKINIKKTACMNQPVILLYPPTELELITVSKEPLIQALDFTYLGSTVSNSARLDKELQTRKGKASAAFSKLQHRL